MLSNEMRRKFLKYFKEKGHTILPSSPVVPHEDPTLLFTNAGMNQFKDVFLGKTKRDYTTAATSQKCIRVGGKHNDLDNVGHTSRHLTFFEMLGNFSFGDYFKDKAILYAWEVSTKIFGFNPEKIWITIFREDDEAFEIWKKIASEKRIVRMDEKDNFWVMGDTGPCGPCSELLFDRGTKYGSAPSPKEDTSGERYLEFWNLVFMQFNRDSSGKMAPLPKQSIDTGSGLERAVSLKMNVDNVFETDILRSLIEQTEKVTGKAYKEENAPAFHVIADHIRSLSFAIADGAQPSNVERGYVLRKILRRAVRYGKLLGMQDPFLAKILPRLIETMGADYKELKESEKRIAEILTLEEEAFLRTLKRGGNILNTIIEKSQKQKEITGEDAFKLKDTYGLPIEEVLLIAKDANLKVNLEAYQILEEKAKELSRSAHVSHHQEIEESLYKEFVSKHGTSKFVGYDQTEIEATIIGIIVDGKFAPSLKEGEEGQIILDQTPFYAEKGGQVGDTGSLSHHRAHFSVGNCQSPYSGVIVHIGKCIKGDLILGEPITARVEGKRRLSIQNNHTATHLLHFALQQILGPHVRQAGSLVEEDRLRFDFNHHKALSSEELVLIEELVNEKIREDKLVETYELSYDDVQKRSDIKQFFGDKYGSKVRVIDLDYSKELCGGTHTTRTGTIGLFRITKEGSIAAGVRRIEAATGKKAEEFLRQKENELHEKIGTLSEEIKELHHQLKVLRRSGLKEISSSLAQKSVLIGSVPFLAAIISIDSEDLASFAEDLMQKLSSAVLLLAVKNGERCQILLKVSSDLVKKGINAQEIIKEIAPLIGGSGGGRPEMAQAGGKTPGGIEKAFEKVKQLLQRAR